MGFSVVQMKDMSKTREQKAEHEEKMMAPSTERNYPYGLCLHLDACTLENLEVEGDDMPEVGDMIHLMAMAKVTAVRINDTEAGPDRCVELQITHLALEDEDEEEPGEDYDD